MADSYSKKENNKKKLEKQKLKNQRREERKSDNNKGKDATEMFMYVDQFGRLVETPPVKGEEIELSDIQLGAAPMEDLGPIKTGFVTYQNEKGYGFITENDTKENIFYHENNCEQPLKKGNKVSFEKERTDKGWSAMNIKVIK